MEQIPYIFYRYLHLKIWEMNNGNYIKIKSLKKYLFQWKIPSKIRPLIIKELILLGLLEKEDKHFLKINTPKFNMEDLNRYYRKLNIF